MTQNYEYKTVSLRDSHKEFHSKWVFRISKRMQLVTDKLGKEGWELTNTTHDMWGNPQVLTFRKVSE